MEADTFGASDTFSDASSAPVWSRTCALATTDDLELAADIVRLLDRVPGLDSEEIAHILGVDAWRAFEVTAALMDGWILGEAR